MCLIEGYLQRDTKHNGLEIFHVWLVIVGQPESQVIDADGGPYCQFEHLVERGKNLTHHGNRDLIVELVAQAGVHVHQRIGMSLQVRTDVELCKEVDVIVDMEGVPHADEHRSTFTIEEATSKQLEVMLFGGQIETDIAEEKRAASTDRVEESTLGKDSQ